MICLTDTVESSCVDFIVDDDETVLGDSKPQLGMTTVNQMTLNNQSRCSVCRNDEKDDMTLAQQQQQPAPTSDECMQNSETNFLPMSDDLDPTNTENRRETHACILPVTITESQDIDVDRVKASNTTLVVSFVT